MATGVIEQRQSVKLTSFQSSWNANGQCFCEVIGNYVHLHLSIRGGSTTDGAKVLAIPSLAPSSAALAPIFNVNDKTLNGYILVNTSGNVTTTGITNNQYVISDVFWLM